MPNKCVIKCTVNTDKAHALAPFHYFLTLVLSLGLNLAFTRPPPSILDPGVVSGVTAALRSFTRIGAVLAALPAFGQMGIIGAYFFGHA